MTERENYRLRVHRGWGKAHYFQEGSLLLGFISGHNFFVLLLRGSPLLGGHFFWKFKVI